MEYSFTPDSGIQPHRGSPDWLWYTRFLHGYTRAEFARMLGVKETTLAEMEAGRQPIPAIVFEIVDRF